MQKKRQYIVLSFASTARAMGWDEERLAEDVDRIGERVTHLLRNAQESDEAPGRVAERLTAERLAAAKDI